LAAIDLNKGYFDCTYHYVIRRGGEIEYGRDYHNHAMGLGSKLNPWSVSICIIGGVGEPVITEAQITTTKDVLNALLLEYPEADVIDKPERGNPPPPPKVALAHYFTPEGTPGC
jgi:hypothetical protein